MQINVTCTKEETTFRMQDGYELTLSNQFLLFVGMPKGSKTGNGVTIVNHNGITIYGKNIVLKFKKQEYSRLLDNISNMVYHGEEFKNVKV